MHTKKENFVICEICTGHFKTKEALNVHMKLKHCPEKPQCFECLTCGKSFAHEPSLKRHLRIKNINLKYPLPHKKQGIKFVKFVVKKLVVLTTTWKNIIKVRPYYFPVTNVTRNLIEKIPFTDTWKMYTPRITTIFQQQMSCLKLGKKSGNAKHAKKVSILHGT